MHLQLGGDRIEIDVLGTLHRDSDSDRRALDERAHAGAVECERQARCGRREHVLARRDVPHLEATTARLVLDQHDPMRMPIGAVIVRIAVAVLIEQWRVIEIRVGGDR